MATTKNREEAVESDNVDMEPVSGIDSDEIPTEEDMGDIDNNSYEDGTESGEAVSDYEMSDQGTVIDDTYDSTADDWDSDTGMSDDSWSDGTEEMTDSGLPDEDLVPAGDDTEAEQ